ncbi:MAG: ATP-dependent RecD-like DNA helicase [Polyangiaceae bacterium]|nr:ATP-dependent RecD-like DNA helicase [Polyangiaceae bacterium]
MSRPPQKPAEPRRDPPAAPARTGLGGGQAQLFAKAPSGDGITIDGEVVRITYSSDETGFRVIRVKLDGRAEEKTLVGVFPLPPPGTRVRATGKLTRDVKRGEQFKVETLLTVAPATLSGVERFLGSGLVPGVGAAFAKKIVETFGEQTLEVLDHNPSRLNEVAGLGAKRASQIEKAWEAHRAVGAIMIFLQSHGASPALASRIYKRFGPRAVAIVSASPYRLALDVWGVGFKTADRIASSLGIAKDAPERAQAGVLQVLHERSTSGHVFTERGQLRDLCARMLEIDEAKVEVAIDALLSEKRARAEIGLSGIEGVAIYTPALYDAEVRIARKLAELVATPVIGRPLDSLVERVAKDFEEKSNVSLAPAQRDAVELAARSKVVVITGGPGVGKTTIVRALLMLFDQAGLKTRLAAPTGRAAKRMTEATKREAVTLHRLLEFDPKTREFTRNEMARLDIGALVVDESSMVDLELMDALVSALPQQARLVLVGDVDQLPSVGPGAVLRDAITSEVIPTARLSQIFRQAAGSLIVQNAHRIHAGELPISDRGQEGEFYLVERKDDEAAADALVGLVTERIPKAFGLHPVRDVQILTPMHKGASGTIALNERLQTALNPNGPTVKVGQRVFRLGDKVMQLKNDYDREVYNGDLGFISKIDQEARVLVVTFDDRQVTYEEGDLEELTLAYATSIHKSQGSEYAAVVIPFTMNHFVMLSRNLLYTAVTRGKRLVVIVGSKRAISLSLAEIRKETRSTALAERLRAAVRG